MRRYKSKVISYHGSSPTFGFTCPNDVHLLISETKFTCVLSGPNVMYISGPGPVTQQEAEAYNYN